MMNKKRAFLIIFVLLTLILGFMLNPSFSAYASCRKVAMKAKGYAVWNHVSTTEDGSQSLVSFSDEYNNSLTCTATSVGFIWIAGSYSRTLVGCDPSLGNRFDPCPEDYFGVEP